MSTEPSQAPAAHGHHDFWADPAGELVRWQQRRRLERAALVIAGAHLLLMAVAFALQTEFVQAPASVPLFLALAIADGVASGLAVAAYARTRPPGRPGAASRSLSSVLVPLVGGLGMAVIFNSAAPSLLNSATGSRAELDTVVAHAFRMRVGKSECPAVSTPVLPQGVCLPPHTAALHAGDAVTLSVKQSWFGTDVIAVRTRP
jgi:hypothetical protein